MYYRQTFSGRLLHADYIDYQIFRPTMEGRLVNLRTHLLQQMFQILGKWRINKMY
jgi:hypothetical protein